MEHREELHDMLTSILGSNQVYFQPPESIRMSYPAFVYYLENYPVVHANDDPYKVDERYIVTYITKDAVSSVPKELAKAHGFYFDRHYIVDNLHHFVYTRLYQ